MEWCEWNTGAILVGMGVSLKIPEAAELTRIQSMKEEVVLEHRSHHPAAWPDAYRGEHIPRLQQ